MIPDLLLSSALSFVDSTLLEWHAHHPFVSSEETARVKEAVEALCGVAEDKQLHNRCNIREMDDETYFTFNGPLPVC